MNIVMAYLEIILFGLGNIKYYLISIRFKGKTRYNLDCEDPWLHPQWSPWVQSVNTDSSDNVFHFQCKVCKGGKVFLFNISIAAAKKRGRTFC